jgi:hypothetical protein
MYAILMFRQFIDLFDEAMPMREDWIYPNPFFIVESRLLGRTVGSEQQCVNFNESKTKST